MFEAESPDALLSAIEAGQREESVVMARRMAAIAALLWHRVQDAEKDDPDLGYMLVTGFARTCAEVSAALNMSPRASRQLVGQAETLDTRLPKIAALLAAGQTDWPTVQIIIARTDLVDNDLTGQLDAELAGRISRWQCWSRRRIINAVDAAVQVIDPEAAKERRVRADIERHLSITPLPNGMAQVRGNLSAPAGALFDARLAEMATSVCARDSRTIAQRRSDAVEALCEGRLLACDCGQPDCPARPTEEDAPAPGGVSTLINVIATEATLAGDSDAPGYLDGYGVIDADQVRELAETAAIQPIEQPEATGVQALRYQPSAALARWIRFRDLTCRFPGCDRRATFCDLDHTMPFNHDNPLEGGWTVPWDLACYCREHHRLKTFHAGPEGWRDRQLADGTIVWISPTGRIYRTDPSGADLFDDLRPPCMTPAPRPRNRNREKAARIARARNRLRDQRPVNAEHRRINTARRKEIAHRTWRNNMRRTLKLFKGNQPSTSPWCTWINDPEEPEHIPIDWQPPLPAQPLDDDEPPF